MSQDLEKRLVEEADRAELEQLRREKAELEAKLQAKDEEILGVQEGKVRCLTFSCPFGEKAAKFERDEHVRYFKDERGNLTNRVENSTVYWHLRDQDANCPHCSAPLNQLPPGAASAFPKGYRFQFGEPVA